MSIFNYKIDPFCYEDEEDIKSINNALNLKNFGNLFDQNLSFCNVENAFFVKENLVSNISMIELNNETLAPTDIVNLYIISSIPDENNLVSVSMTFKLKPNENEKIIVYAFSIYKSSISQNFTNPIFNGKELILNNNETQFDFNGKEYLSFSVPGKLTLNFIAAQDIISIYYCVADLNLKNSSKVANFTLSDYFFSVEPSGPSIIMGILLGVLIGLFVGIIITIILILRRRPQLEAII